MSTRAERRLKEAQEAHQDAVSAHLSVTSRFNALDAQADAGEDVDPLEYATAEGAVKIAAKRMERTQRAVQQEQTIVTQERTRAVHRELVEAAGDIPAFEEQAAPIMKSIAAYAQQARGNADAWEAVCRRVLDEIGTFPWEGEAAAVAAQSSGVPDLVSWFDTPTGRAPRSTGRLQPDRFWLDGVVYLRPSLTTLEGLLTEEVHKIFQDAQSISPQGVAA